MIRKLGFLFFVTAVFTGAAAQAAAPQNFSADVTGKSAEGIFRAKIYMQDGNVRMEMPQAVTITRSDKKVVWLLMPTERMYLEQPVTPRDTALSGSASNAGEVKREPLGTDTVNGKTVKKFQVTYAGEGAPVSVYEWKDSAFEMPVKIAAVDGSWSMEYTNIKTGAQAASLFEIPRGYQKFVMPDMAAAFGNN